tara:strand:+ start:44 stop:463 length:420 start_codon:yes stop_codon:yes gene_type:complete
MMQKDAIYIEDFLYFHIKLSITDKIEFVYDLLKNDVAYAVDKHLNIKEEFIDEVNTSDIEPLIISAVKIEDQILGISIHGDELYLNSDSLKLIRRYVNKMCFDGMVLSRLRNKKKSVYDPLRFFRAYKIIGHGIPISMN